MADTAPAEKPPEAKADEEAKAPAVEGKEEEGDDAKAEGGEGKDDKPDAKDDGEKTEPAADGDGASGTPTPVGGGEAPAAPAATPPPPVPDPAALPSGNYEGALLTVPDVVLRKVTPSRESGLSSASPLYEALQVEKVNSTKSSTKPMMYSLTPRMIMLSKPGTDRISRVISVLDIDVIYVKQAEKGNYTEMLIKMTSESNTPSTILRFKGKHVEAMRGDTLARLKRVWHFMKGNDVPYNLRQVPGSTDYKKNKQAYGPFAKYDAEKISARLVAAPPRPAAYDIPQPEPPKQETPPPVLPAPPVMQMPVMQMPPPPPPPPQPVPEPMPSQRRQRRVYYPRADDGAVYSYEPPPPVAEGPAPEIYVPPAEPKVVIPADMLDILRAKPPVMRRVKKHRERAGEPTHAADSPTAKKVHLHLHLGPRGDVWGATEPQIDNNLPVVSPIVDNTTPYPRHSGYAAPYEARGDHGVLAANASGSMGVMRHLRM